MSEVASAFAWINTTLRADTALMAASTGGIFQGIADIGVVAPYTSYGLQSSSEVLTANAVRLWARLLIQIKAVGPASQYAALVTIADRIDANFRRAGPVGLSSSSGVLECYRDGTIALDDPQPVNGVQWTSLGGLYRIDLQGT
jgi:hypothetical protein